MLDNDVKIKETLRKL